MAFKITNEDYPKIETSSREQYCRETVSKLMQTLGNSAVWAAEQDSLLLLGIIVDHILKITLSMFKEKFVTISEGYRKEILGIVDALSKSYMMSETRLRDQGIGAPISSDISDIITSIAIYAIDNQQKEVAFHCEEVLYRMSISSIEQDTYGYDVARCAGRIGVIGTYSLHRKENELSDKALELLVSFDKIYLSKSPDPHDRLHIGEIKSIHQEFTTDYAFSEEEKAYGNLFRVISQKTLDDFIALYESKRESEFINK